MKKYILILICLVGCDTAEEEENRKTQDSIYKVMERCQHQVDSMTRVWRNERFSMSVDINRCMTEQKQKLKVDSMAIYEAMAQKITGTNSVYEHGYTKGHQEAADFIQDALNHGRNVIDRKGKMYLDTTYWKLIKRDPNY